MQNEVYANYAKSEMNINSPKEIENIEDLVAGVCREFNETEEFFNNIISQNIIPREVPTSCDKQAAIPEPTNRIDKIITRLKILKESIVDFRKEQLLALNNELKKL